MSDSTFPVRWAVREAMPRDLRDLLDKDLRTLFSPLRPEAVTVSAVFSGFSANAGRRAVLGVELRTADSFQTHIVKLGVKEEIEPDFSGWKACVLSQNFASRIFVQLRYVELNEGRAAAIYEDGYLLYGKDQKAYPLIEVAEWATFDDKPDTDSVERVIYQVYTELDQWFYFASDDQKPADALAFYCARLRNALDRWTGEDFQAADERAIARLRAEARRDTIWILCAHEDYNCGGDADYLDPVDFVRAALSNEAIPATLVGRSHGDLHGRNMLVGVQRWHAEFPTVFDYGEMGERNVLAWDFAKFETELKRVVLPSLFFRVPAARTALLASQKFAQWRSEPRADDVERILFFHEFETRLAELTERIDAEDFAKDATPLPVDLASGHESVDRFLSILWRIRKEAALCLGFRRGRQNAWLNELYFSLAVYGLCNAKPTWKYEPPQMRCALISAGVAAARLERKTRSLRGQIAASTPPPGMVASYRVPLAHSHRLWKSGVLHEAMSLLEEGRQHFPLAVPLLQEYALVLTDVADRGGDASLRSQALNLIEPLRQLCKSFRDHETLARMGKIFRSHGDANWNRAKLAHGEFIRAKADDWQHYLQAQVCYREAFEITRNYFPGINAATLARIAGDKTAAHVIAIEVKRICERALIGGLSEDDRIWLFATEGEARLVLDEESADEAAGLYQQALTQVHPARKHMAQSMYNQICRLWWALGADRVGPVVDAFRTWESQNNTKLEPGPFTNCS